jgi:hypothetical protein
MEETYGYTRLPRHVVLGKGKNGQFLNQAPRFSLDRLADTAH